MLQRLPPFFDTFLTLLFEQYKESPKIVGMLQAFAAEFDLLDQAQVEVATEVLNIDQAVGAQLDMLGRIANLPRAGRDDEGYRAILRASFISRHSGAPDQIIGAIKSITGSTSVQYIPEYPAGYWVLYDGIGLSQSYLNRLSPAGVQGMTGCYLSDTNLDIFVLADGEPILVVGPCPGIYILTEEEGVVLSEEGGEPLLLEIAE